jgi:hypothetical protein
VARKTLFLITSRENREEKRESSVGRTFLREGVGEMFVWKWNSLIIITQVKAALIATGSRLIVASSGN